MEIILRLSIDSDFNTKINAVNNINAVGKLSLIISKGKSHCHLSGLHVSKKNRRNGYARALRTEALTLLKRIGIKRITTKCMSFSEDICSSDLLNFYLDNFSENGFSIHEVTNDNYIIAKLPVR